MGKKYRPITLKLRYHLFFYLEKIAQAIQNNWSNTGDVENNTDFHRAQFEEHIQIWGTVLITEEKLQKVRAELTKMVASDLQFIQLGYIDCGLTKHYPSILGFGHNAANCTNNGIP